MAESGRPLQGLLDCTEQFDERGAIFLRIGRGRLFKMSQHSPIPIWIRACSRPEVNRRARRARARQCGVGTDADLGASGSREPKTTGCWRAGWWVAQRDRRSALIGAVWLCGDGRPDDPWPQHALYTLDTVSEGSDQSSALRRLWEVHAGIGGVADAACATLREAIVRLEAVHFALRQVRRGLVVRSIREEQVLEVYTVRAALDQLAASLAAGMPPCPIGRACHCRNRRARPTDPGDRQR